jgi:hypothetical protein
MALSAPTRLGPYEILGLVGAGGMGDVYRARDPRLGRDVAVKVLPGEVAGDPERLQRFEREARAVAALNHPNILTVHDVGMDPAAAGTPYVVTELLEGETLAERLRKGALSLREAIETAVQVAQGLAAAHAKTIAHRDLKPANVFLTTDGRVKILDFGLARWEGLGPEEATASVATDPGTRLGTVGYMSPEQVRGGRGDHRSDIFSLGVVLYEMLTGRRAFARPSAVETLNAILNEDPPELSGLGTTIPVAVDRLVRRCVEKRPEVRFQSAHDVALALEVASATGGGLAACSQEHPRHAGRAAGGEGEVRLAGHGTRGRGQTPIPTPLGGVGGGRLSDPGHSRGSDAVAAATTRARAAPRPGHVDPAGRRGQLLARRQPVRLRLDRRSGGQLGHLAEDRRGGGGPASHDRPRVRCPRGGRGDA